MAALFDRLPVLIFIIIAVVQVVRAVMKSREAQAEHVRGRDETEEQRRVREIQERIRRVVAERSGTSGEAPPPILAPAHRTPAPPVLRPSTVPPLEPFGRPLTRRLAEMERRLQPTPAVSPTTETRSAELVRQGDLVEKMRVLSETQAISRRRAEQVVTSVAALANSETGMLTASRLRLDEDLADPQSLRRAFVLREVLGTPVGLR